MPTNLGRDKLQQRSAPFPVQTDPLGAAELWSVAHGCLCTSYKVPGSILWAARLGLSPQLLTEQLYAGRTGFLLRRMGKNCADGQGQACPFNFALCTLHGFNVVCAAGLVLTSCGIVWGAEGWECSPFWEGESLFKLSLQTQPPAAERHGVGFGSGWVPLGCLGLGRARSSRPRFCTARVSQVLVAPRRWVAPSESTWDCSTWLNDFRHARCHLPARSHLPGLASQPLRSDRDSGLGLLPAASRSRS